MIAHETVQLIIETAQIVDVVSDFVTLKRRGANFVACCPFHNEKTPSMYVSPSKGIYKCFGCGKSGTAVGFVMESEHCSYQEALTYLARKYNIEIIDKEETAEDIANRQRRESILLVLDFAQKFYSEQLKSGEGLSVAYNYYRNRGIEDNTISLFGLGWAPKSRTALIDAALSQGYKIEYLLAAGLAQQGEKGECYDKFRERVMFPIRSVSGRVLGFSGRTLRSDNPAKYLNSPETEVYVKSRTLLGIYFAKSEISRLKKCILVEGNVDMVMMHQLGIKNVVASCGTSLTVEQVRLIRRFAEELTIMNDGDFAGMKATIKDIDLALQEGLNVKIVMLPTGEDPDSFCRKHSLDEVQRFISDNEKDFIEYKTELFLEEAHGDPNKKGNVINDIADSIANIPDPVKRSVYSDVISAKFGIDSSIIYARVKKTRRVMFDEQKRQNSRAIQAEHKQEEAKNLVPQQEHTSLNIQEENTTLGPIERDLLYFLLSNGCDSLDFESDSEYYSDSEEERTTVAQFIRSALDADGSQLVNSLYRDVYNAYMDLYDKGYDQETIIIRLLNMPDRTLADLVANLSSEKYELTISQFQNALTTTSSWLVNNVPKAILVYAQKRAQDKINTIIKRLRDVPPEEETQLLLDLKRYKNVQRKINQKIGREKTNKI